MLDAWLGAGLPGAGDGRPHRRRPPPPKAPPKGGHKVGKKLFARIAIHCKHERRRALLRTPCFASDFVLCFGVVLCFDDVVLCFARRRTSCCASKTRSAFRSRSGLLCVTPCFAPSREVATQRRWVNFLAFCWSLPLLPLPLSPLVEVLAFPCLFLFLSRREITEDSRKDRDSDCVHSMCLLLLAFGGVASPATEKFCALRAALCSPRYK